MPDGRHRVAVVGERPRTGDKSDLSCSKMMLGTSCRIGGRGAGLEGHTQCGEAWPCYLTLLSHPVTDAAILAAPCRAAAGRSCCYPGCCKMHHGVLA